MLEVTKEKVGDQEWLKVVMIRFDPELATIIMSIDGWAYGQGMMTYGIPYNKVEEFHAKTYNYMVVWKAEGDNMGALTGGIDTSDVPEDYILPYSPKIALRPHQIKTFNLMVQRDQLLIADQEGVGNIAHLSRLHSRDKVVEGENR